MLGIGLIGLGGIASSHLKALRAMEQEGVARCVAAADLIEDVRERHQREWDIPRVYASHTELLGDPDVDAVAIVLGHHLHAPLAIEALQAGKHVLVEKPMAVTMEECDAMLAAEDRSGQILQVGHTWHFHAGPRKAREILDSNELGPMFQAVATVSTPWRFETRRPQYRIRAMGGGFLLANGIHFIDLQTWLLGTRAVAVKAKIGTYMHYQSSDDTATIFVQYENGAVGVVVSIGTTRGASKAVLEGHCTQGQINVRRNDIEIGQDGAWRTIDGDGKDGFAEQYRHFAQAVASGLRPQTSGRYARHVMEILTAAEESSITGREVLLTDYGRQPW